jgi:hypothetical protein
MRILVWPVHGGWMNAFARGAHEYLLPAPGTAAPGTAAPRATVPGDEPGSAALPVPPVLPGRARAASERELRADGVDVVVLQRLEELDETERILGLVPGRDVPAVFVEHNTPKRHPVEERHPLADQDRIPIAHVTHVNRLLWDTGDAVTVVVEHGVPDPGHLYTGELPALGVVVNEPVRRGRVTGTDLLPAFSRSAPLHVFGIDTDLLPGALGLGSERLQVVGDLPTPRLHAELARRRAYLHPMRWTSLGLSLLEAMTLGMPVLALALTEAPRAVPPDAGAISADPAELKAMAQLLLDDPDEAHRRGAVARAFAREHYGLERFLTDWDAVLEDVVARHRARRGGSEAAPRRSGSSPRETRKEGVPS